MLCDKDGFYLPELIMTWGELSFSGSMEEDFFTKTPILKNCSPERNQVAAHAQKRVSVPLIKNKSLLENQYYVS